MGWQAWAHARWRDDVTRSMAAERETRPPCRTTPVINVVLHRGPRPHTPGWRGSGKIEMRARRKRISNFETIRPTERGWVVGRPTLFYRFHRLLKTNSILEGVTALVPLFGNSSRRPPVLRWLLVNRVMTCNDHQGNLIVYTVCEIHDDNWLAIPKQN